MLIFSQDRKKIMDCISVSVNKNFGAKKEEKFILYGRAGIDASLDGNSILAAYPDEKTAMDELEKLFAAFADGAKSYKL